MTHPADLNEDGIVPALPNDKPSWMEGYDLPWACPEHNLAVLYRIGDGTLISQLYCPKCGLRADGSYRKKW